MLINSKAPSVKIFSGDIDSIWKIGPGTYMHEPQKKNNAETESRHGDDLLCHGTNTIVMYQPFCGEWPVHLEYML